MLVVSGRPYRGDIVLDEIKYQDGIGGMIKEHLVVSLINQGFDCR